MLAWILSVGAQELRQALHGRFQDAALRRITNAEGTLAAGAEGHAGRQAYSRLGEQLPAECERIRHSLDPREQIERAVRFGNRHAGQAVQGVEAERSEEHTSELQSLR